MRTLRTIATTAFVLMGTWAGAETSPTAGGIPIPNKQLPDKTATAQDWSVSVDPLTSDCLAELEGSDGYSLLLTSFRQQIWLGVSPADGFSRRDYQIGTIRGDRKSSLNVGFVDEFDQFRTILTPVLAEMVRRSARIQVDVGGRSLTFNSTKSESAIESVLKCATAHGDTEASGAIVRPQLSGSSWTWANGASGGCTLRASGYDLDTILMLNEHGDLILTAGRSDWTLPSRTGEIALKVDQQPPVTVVANTFQNLVLVKVTDPTLLQELKRGTVVTWYLPSGPMASNISGLEDALKALSSCKNDN